MAGVRHLMRRLALSEEARDRLARIVAGLLTAIVVISVIIIIVALLKQCPPNTGPNYPTTRFTTYPSRPPIYKNCSEAHKDGRWNIPATDPAYRRALDKDGNGIACESRKPG